MNGTPASLARDWIVANFIAMLVIAACGLAGYFARTALGADSPGVRAGTLAAYMTIETVLAFVSFGAYANLTGRVLQRVLPRFPWRDWLAVHLAIGLVAGPCVALLMAEGEGEPMDWSDTGLVVLLFTAGPALAALLGVAIGGLQAVVLKRVARGMLRWIGFSALSVGVMLTAVLPVELAMPQQRTFGTEIITESALVVAGVLAAIVMLPALKRLQPLA